MKKPKRPRSKGRPVRKRTCKMCAQWTEQNKRLLNSIDRFGGQLQKAEADKRILLDENLRLRECRDSDMRALKMQADMLSVGDSLLIQQHTMLDALCRALEIANVRYELQEGNTIGARAERDALAKRNQELEAENYAYKTNRTKSMMTVEKWT